MAARHTNYSKIRKESSNDSEITSMEVADSGIGDPPKRYVYQKKDDTPVRIRKGPGTSFDHNGKYIDRQKKVEIVEVQDGWGLLSTYEETRDGWVCLEFIGETFE